MTDTSIIKRGRGAGKKSERHEVNRVDRRRADGAETLYAFGLRDVAAWSKVSIKCLHQAVRRGDFDPLNFREVAWSRMHRRNRAQVLDFPDDVIGHRLDSVFELRGVRPSSLKVYDGYQWAYGYYDIAEQLGHPELRGDIRRRVWAAGKRQRTGVVDGEPVYRGPVFSVQHFGSVMDYMVQNLNSEPDP